MAPKGRPARLRGKHSSRKSRPPTRLAGYGSPRRLYGASVYSLPQQEGSLYPGGGGAASIAAASLGIAIGKAGVSGWDLQSFNESDPVDVALAAGLRESAATHVASSTAAAYRGP